MVRTLTPSEPNQYDCISCGRCCYYDQPNYAILFPEDVAVFGPAGLAEYTAKSTLSGASLRPGEDGSEIYMRMDNGRCCALEVTPGVSYECAIYADRPLVCQMFEPGGSECLKARARPTQEMLPARC